MKTKKIPIDAKGIRLNLTFYWLLEDHTFYVLVFLVNDFLDNSGKIYVHMYLEKNASNE